MQMSVTDDVNGEIYNFIEIRDELKKKGYTFRSASDSEVIMAAFCEWGESCVERFNGMWTFGHLGIKQTKQFSFPETVLE